jgi:hypothetical protein
LSYFSVVVVTERPEDVGDALAPFDENRAVDSYPEVLGTVADAASSARSDFLSTPESVPCPRMDLPRVQGGPRPGRQRSTEHTRRGALGARLRRRSKTAPHLVQEGIRR